jgi:hypothetical protein
MRVGNGASLIRSMQIMELVFNGFAKIKDNDNPNSSHGLQDRGPLGTDIISEIPKNDYNGVLSSKEM